MVDYDGIHIAYERKELTELSHAYCTSIHKAQGSEYPIVIMPVVRSYRHMLMKNIVYTGITRAKESLIETLWLVKTMTHPFTCCFPSR